MGTDCHNSSNHLLSAAPTRHKDDKTKPPRCYPKLTRWRLGVVLAVVGALALAVYVYPSPIYEKPGAVTMVTNTTAAAAPEARSHDGRLRAKHTTRHLPHCLIIGARKAGTRALLNFLDLHPQIRVAKNEVHFFDENENYQLGIDWYRKKMPFAYPDQVTMEKTPAYFSTDYVPERVYKMNATVKLLLIVRDPIDRAMSDYLQIHENKVKKNKPDPSFDEHCLDENGEVDHTFNPLKRSIYFRQMQRWLDWFSMDQILVLNGENLVKNPVEELRRVEEFLGIEHKITSANFYFNDTRGFFCMRNETHEKCLAESKGREHPSINPLVLQKLREFFRPFNNRFYKMIGRDMGWS